MILDGWIWRDGRMVRNKSSCDAVKSGRDALTLLQYGVHSLAALQPLAILQPRRFAGLSLWPCEKGAGGHFPLDLPKLWTKTEPKKKGITLFVGLRLKSSSPLGASRWVPGWMEEQQHRGEQKPLGNQTGVHRVYSTSNSPWQMWDVGIRILLLSTDVHGNPWSPPLATFLFLGIIYHCCNAVQLFSFFPAKSEKMRPWK